MEVFLFFSTTDELGLVEATMQAWERIQWADPFNVVQTKAHQFEIQRRVIADNMSEGEHYILTDIGCVPENERAIPILLGNLKAADGLIGFDGGLSEFPTGVRVCGRKIIKAWPKQTTPTYDKEHAEAIRATGKNVATWPIHFKRIQAC